MSLTIWQKLAGAALAVLSLTYGYNVRRNLAGAEQIHGACASIRRSIDEQMNLSSLSMLIDDPAALSRDLRAEIDAPCVTVEPRLAWWRWNLGVHVPIPPDAARLARLEAGRVAIITRCIPVIRKLLDSSNLTGAAPEALEAEATQRCNEIGGSLHSPMSEASASIAVWDWPDHLSALARSLSPPPPEAGPAHAP